MKEMVKDVKLVIKQNYTTQYLIKSLSNHEKHLTSDENEQLTDILEDQGFGEDFIYKILGYFPYSNPIHRGILIGLLTYTITPPISAFYPLQDYGKNKPEEVDQLIKNWGNFILLSFNLSNKKNDENKKSKTKKSKTKKSKTTKSKTTKYISYDD